MSLRRTALTRRTELRRVKPMPRAKRERAARAEKTIHRSTGPTPAQRRVVAERAGYACELCPTLLHDGTSWTGEHSFHHRLPRRMGGSSRPELNWPSNLLLLCGSGDTGCHGWVESHRATARERGLLLSAGAEPHEVPVFLRVRRLGPVLLRVDGTYWPAR